MSETRETLCADARCEHPKGWHRRGIGSCLECGCPGFKPEPPNLIVGKHPRRLGEDTVALHD